MFGSGGYGSGIGSSGGGSGQPSGDQLLVSVVAEVVPVRLVMNQPIKVQVVHFPGVPPPLPGLSAEPYVPGLPKRQSRPAAKSGLDYESLAGIAPMVPGGSLMAGIAGAAGPIGAILVGVAAFTEAVGLLTDTFVAPITSAIKGGFQSGVSGGMGSGTLGKSFEILGTVVGIQLLPAMIRLGGIALSLADIWQKVFDRAKYLLSKIPGSGIESGGSSPGLWTRAQGIGDKFFRAIGISGPKIREAMTGMDSSKINAKLDSGELGGMEAFRKSLLLSTGSQSSYYGIADIREQAQLAALNQDPLEAKRNQLIIDALTKMPDLVKASEETAKNTAPTP